MGKYDVFLARAALITGQLLRILGRGLGHCAACLSVAACLYAGPITATPIRLAPRLVPESRVARALDRAQTLMAQGQTEVARGILHEVLRNHPGLTEARLLLGASYLETEPWRTRKAAILVLRPLPQSREALDLLSNAYERIRAEGLPLKEARRVRQQEIDDYGIVLDQLPDHAEALYRRASHRIALQRLAPQRVEELVQAEDELQAAITVLKKSKSKTLLLASTHYQLGRVYKHMADHRLANAQAGSQVQQFYEKALSQFKTALEYDAERIDALGEIVLIHRQRKEINRAIAAVMHHLQAVRKDRYLAKDYEMLGQLYFEANQSYEAVEALKKSIAHSAQSYGAYLYLAQVQIDNGARNAAIETLQASIDANPNFIEGYYFLASALSVGHDMNKAIAVYEQLFTVEPSRAVFVGMAPSRNLYRNKIYRQAAINLVRLYTAVEEDSELISGAIERAKRYGASKSTLVDLRGNVQSSDERQ